MTKLNAPVVIGVDVGGTKILCGYVTEDGDILKSSRFPIDVTSQGTAIKSIYHAVDSFLDEEWEGPSPRAFGIGLVGHVDPLRGTWKSAINIPIQETIDISYEMSNRYGLPVFVDNDVQSATLAEMKFGRGKHLKNFIYLNVGTGVAIGIVNDGQLVRGTANYTGELGHTSLNMDGVRCACGQRGCLETIGSGGGIIDQALAHLSEFPSSKLHGLNNNNNLNSGTIFQAAESGDDLALLLKEQTIKTLGTALVGVVNVLNPEGIVLGGGVFQNEEIIYQLRTHVLQRSLPVASHYLTHFASTTLKVNKVGLLGAASLGWDK